MSANTRDWLGMADMERKRRQEEPDEPIHSCFCCKAELVNGDCPTCDIAREVSGHSQRLFCDTHLRYSEGATSEAWPR